MQAEKSGLARGKEPGQHDEDDEDEGFYVGAVSKWRAS